jgi:hypothetical protein
MVALIAATWWTGQQPPAGQTPDTGRRETPAERRSRSVWRLCFLLSLMMRERTFADFGRQPKGARGHAKGAPGASAGTGACGASTRSGVCGARRGKPPTGARGQRTRVPLAALKGFSVLASCGNASWNSEACVCGDEGAVGRSGDCGVVELGHRIIRETGYPLHASLGGQRDKQQRGLLLPPDGPRDKQQRGLSSRLLSI